MAKQTARAQPTVVATAAPVPAHDRPMFGASFRTIGAVLIGLATFVAGAIPIYNIGLETGRAELKTRQDLASMDLPAISREARDSVTKLSQAAAEFKDMLAENATYLDMKARFDGLTQQVADLEKQTAAANAARQEVEARLNEVSDRLAKLTDRGQIYEVRKGNAATLFGGLLTVGLVDVTVSDVATIKLNGIPHEVTAGEVLGLAGGKQCTVRVQQVQFIGGSFSFTVDCSEALKQGSGKL